MNIGISCYPSVGGSGIVATMLGQELAKRGHQIHFISYERPFRLVDDHPNIHFHQVTINDYELFKYPDYTLPLSVKMSEVCRDHHLDILHVHYAVPHATAAILSRCMLWPGEQPKVVTTLHGTDTTLLGHDPGYGPAILHALNHSDAVTAVSRFLARESLNILGFKGKIDVIPNFYDPVEPTRHRAEVRKEIGVGDDEMLIVHSSNLRASKRIDLLLESIALIDQSLPFKLLVLAGDRFEPFISEVKRLGLEKRIISLENVLDIENYLQCADLGLITSQSESFCLSILEAMAYRCPSVAFDVGGISEVVDDGINGVLVPFGDVRAVGQALTRLIVDADYRQKLGKSSFSKAQERFVSTVVLPQYESLYRMRSLLLM